MYSVYHTHIHETVNQYQLFKHLATQIAIANKRRIFHDNSHIKQLNLGAYVAKVCKLQGAGDCPTQGKCSVWY